jgi:hypothetical protein
MAFDLTTINGDDLARPAGIFVAALIFELIRRYRARKKVKKAHRPRGHRHVRVVHRGGSRG